MVRCRVAAISMVTTADDQPKNFECLPEEVGTVDDRSGEVPRLEVEGNDLISRHAVKVAVRAESQASGVAEERSARQV